MCCPLCRQRDGGHSCPTLPLEWEGSTGMGVAVHKQNAVSVTDVGPDFSQELYIVRQVA